MGNEAEQEDDPQIEQWKIRRLIKSLNNARGNGTSMISIIVPPRANLNDTTKLLADELGAASNIKSRVNRQSVCSAIASAQQKLKTYNRTPNKGLIVYVGEILTEDGKERKLTIAFEPFKPINTSLYLCDSKFHTEDLAELLESDDRFGFIVMDGNGSLYGTLQGNNREVLHKFSVDLPKKHGRGGQSALRFARLRLEKRHNYLRKVAELATQHFITNDRPNVTGLVLAGSAEFKNDLSRSDLFDPRLNAVLLKLVDVSYGGENGFNQAIELCAECFKNVKFIHEKRIISKFMDELAQDTGKYCFGMKDTISGLEMGAVENLIVWENLEYNRVTFHNPHTDKEWVLFLSPAQEKDPKLYRDQETGVEIDAIETIPFVEWIVANYKIFGTNLEFVSDKSQEGNQFVKGFGGIGGVMRYRVDFDHNESDIENNFEDDDDEWI